MALQVNQELYAGCGACIDECSVGAIQKVGQYAMINNTLCTECEACLDVCPNQAISARAISEPNVPMITQPATGSHLVPVRNRATPMDMAVPARSLKPLAGAALAFLESDVAPLLLDTLMTALERRFSQPTTAITPLSAYQTNPPILSRGKRRHARYRGGSTSCRKREERR